MFSGPAVARHWPNASLSGTARLGIEKGPLESATGVSVFSCSLVGKTLDGFGLSMGRTHTNVT